MPPKVDNKASESQNSTYGHQGYQTQKGHGKSHSGQRDPNNRTDLTMEDKKYIHQLVRKKYAQVSQTAEGSFQYPTGRSGLVRLGYPEMINALAQDILSCFCGVGNPFSLGPLKQGEKVLDIGCGCGVDTLLAGLFVGADGRAVGIDAVQEMISTALENRKKSGINNVNFKVAYAQSLPFPQESFDLAISNGSLNLVTEKDKAMQEIFRVLKPGGRLMMADQILTAKLPRDKKSRIEKWAG